MYGVSSGGKASGLQGVNAVQEEVPSTPREVWQILNTPHLSSREMLVKALNRLPNRHLDLSQQEPLSERALGELLAALDPASGYRDQPRLQQLVLGRIDGFSALCEHLPTLRVESLDLSQLGVRLNDQYVPPSVSNMKLLCERVAYFKGTVLFDRNRMLQAHARQLEDLPRKNSALKIGFKDTGFPATEREAMFQRAFHDLLSNKRLLQAQVNELLDDPGFAIQSTLDLADMARDTPAQWPGLKAVLASPNSPVRTLVLPSPSDPAMATGFCLDREYSWYVVPTYIKAVLSPSDKAQPEPARLETVRLKGWNASEIGRFKNWSSDFNLNAFPVTHYVISEPVDMSPDALLEVVEWHSNVRLENVEEGQRARYSHLCWRWLIRSDQDVPRDLGIAPEFSNRRLDFASDTRGWCARQEWLRLAKVLAHDGCRLDTLVFGNTTVSYPDGGRHEFLSAFVFSGRKLDLSRWETRMPEIQSTGSFFEEPGRAPFGRSDADFLLSLSAPEKPTVIVLSEQCIAELKPTLECLVKKGWTIEDPKGQRVAGVASGAKDSEPPASLPVDAMSIGSTVVSSPAATAGLSAQTFAGRRQEIDNRISSGQFLHLRGALLSWLDLRDMSETQLKELKSMAAEHGKSHEEDIRKAANILLEVTDELLTKLTGTTVGHMPSKQPPAPLDKQGVSKTMSISSTGVSSSAATSGLSAQTFAVRRQEIDNRISSGQSFRLKGALLSWLELRDMSETQLKELQAMAAEYGTSRKEDIQEAANILKDVTGDLLAKLTRTTGGE